jgi:hypothetical protein
LNIKEHNEDILKVLEEAPESPASINYLRSITKSEWKRMQKEYLRRNTAKRAGARHNLVGEEDNPLPQQQRILEQITRENQKSGSAAEPSAHGGAEASSPEGPHDRELGQEAPVGSGEPQAEQTDAKEPETIKKNTVGLPEGPASPRPRPPAGREGLGKQPGNGPYTRTTGIEERPRQAGPHSLRQRRKVYRP